MLFEDKTGPSGPVSHLDTGLSCLTADQALGTMDSRDSGYQMKTVVCVSMHVRGLSNCGHSLLTWAWTHSSPVPGKCLVHKK